MRNHPAPTVLVVDDDAALTELVATTLDAEGYLVRTAADGADGLAEIEREPPDVVVSDIWMPRLNGYELADRLIDRGHRIPLVLMSGIVPDACSSRLRFLQKPFKLGDLLATVENALASRAC